MCSMWPTCRKVKPCAYKWVTNGKLNLSHFYFFFVTHHPYPRLEPVFQALWTTILLSDWWSDVSPTLCVLVNPTPLPNTSSLLRTTKLPSRYRIMASDQCHRQAFQNDLDFAMHYILPISHLCFTSLRVFTKCPSPVGRELKLWSSFQMLQELQWQIQICTFVTSVKPIWKISTNSPAISEMCMHSLMDKITRLFAVRTFANEHTTT